MSIKISDISNILLQDPQNEKWDKKYIDGLIKEQLAVLDYKKTFPQGLNEQDEDKDDEDVELEPENIPIPKEEPENIKISDDELIPKSDEEEITVEPDVEVAPETIPVPDEPISPEIEKKQAEYTTISKEQARELLSFKGKIFQAVFTKRGDGSLRAMNGLTGVRKYTSGGELPYSPKDKGLVPVYDLKIGNGPKGYRMLNLDGLKTLHMDGKKYKIDPFLREIKINQELNPTDEKQTQAFEDVSNTTKSTFTVDGNTIEVILSVNPTVSFEYIDKIYGTHLQNLMTGDKHFYEDLKDEIPEKFQKVGILSFSVNEEYGTTKLRNTGEQSNIQLYLKILNNVFNVAKKYFSKYDPNVIIINYPDRDIPSDIHKKRNNTYKQYIEKNSWGHYNVKEKNGILYLEKNNLNTMNEIKRLQQLAGILSEIKINNPLIDSKKLMDLYNSLHNKIEDYFEENDTFPEIDEELEELGNKYGFSEGVFLNPIKNEKIFNILDQEEKTQLYKDLEILLNK